MTPVPRIAASLARLSSVCLIGVAALALQSCASKAKSGAKAKPEPFRMYEWHEDAASGPPSIVIYLDQQKALFYRGKKNIGWTYVATGKPSHPTPTGRFSILEKHEDKISNLYGVLLDSRGDVIKSDFNLMKDELPEGALFKPARMPFYMRIQDDGTGMHAGPIPQPGATASHGCIRLPREMAVAFFNNVEVGTPVTIYPRAPK
jgi:hypothetical protein